jgi:predicted MFS family arabinose efflux permease
MFSTLAQFLTTSFGASLASVGLSSFYLARLPGSLLAGYMISRWGQRRFLATVFALTGAALLAVSALSEEFALILAAILVLGFQQATVPVAAMALAGTQGLDGARRAGYGLLFAASELGVALSLAVAQATGTLLGNFSYVLLIFGALYVVGGLSTWRLTSTETR